jgi:hypothetical protein
LILLAIGLFIGASIGFIFAAILAINPNEDETGPHQGENTSPPYPPPDFSSKN